MEWSNFNGVVRFSNGGNSSDGRLNAATVQSSHRDKDHILSTHNQPTSHAAPSLSDAGPPFQTYLYHHQEIYRNLPIPGLDRILEKLSASSKKKEHLAIHSPS